MMSVLEVIWRLVGGEGVKRTRACAPLRPPRGAKRRELVLRASLPPTFPPLPPGSLPAPLSPPPSLSSSWHASEPPLVPAPPSPSCPPQVVVGLERLVESMPLAKKHALILNGATVIIRFTNNVIGGEQFVDMARYFGIQ